ncbi:23268_t:CDS:2 [Rhizophagus irregularis]|nr:23268_t:CDS:2 [Rhizophagus irregularis]
MSISQENNILPSSSLPYGNLSPMTSATGQRNNSMQPITPSLAFFYNPPGILVNYHITCEEVPISFELVYQLTNDTDDNNQTYNYDQPKSYVFYHSQIDTKKIYQQYLINYLATKEIYKQNLHGNMMQDNFNDEIVNGSPSFRGDYTQEYENMPSIPKLQD